MSEPSSSMEEKPAVFKWLPVPKSGKHVRSTDKTLGLLEETERCEPTLSRMLKLYEFFTPPILDRRYHNMNVSELMKIDNEFHYQSVAAGFVCSSQVFGLHFMNDVQTKQYQKMSLVGKDEKTIDTDLEQVDDFINILSQHRVLESTPKSADEAKKPEEILLEPCVIIQLPWNSVLYHQWLMAALAQVLLFEKQSVELRHWPLPAQLEPCAREILFLVKQLKERVILGFHVQSRQVNIYPQVDKALPGLILDQVVLPSLATLQFLTSGKADEVLRSIKKTSWSKCEKEEEAGRRSYVPRACYDYEPGEWADLYHDLYIHYLYWSEGDSYGPFGFYYQEEDPDEDVVLKAFVSQCNSDNVEMSADKSSSDFIKKSTEEDILHRVYCVRGSFDGSLKVEPTVKLTLDVVKKVFGLGYLPAEKLESCIKMFDCDLVRNNIGDLKKRNENLSKLQVAVIEHCEMYSQAYNKLVGSDGEKQDGVLCRVINMQLEILEKEQLIRVAQFLGCMLNVTPAICSQDKSTPMSVKTMTKLVGKVRESRESQDRDWLWSQFSGEWRRPVEVPDLDLEMTLTSLVEHLENRIGRIVFNTAQKCFEVFENGGDIFQHWQLFQYILPCFVSFHVSLTEIPEFKSDKHVVESRIKFLHDILKYYENLYEVWHTKVSPRKIPTYTETISCCEIRELLFTLDYCNSQLGYMLFASTCPSKFLLSEKQACVFLFERMNKGLTGWVFSSQEQYTEITEYSCIKPWLLQATNINKDICNIFCQSYQIPLPGALLDNKLLQKVYFINAVVLALENVHFKCVPKKAGGKYILKKTVNTRQMLSLYRKKIGKYRINLFVAIIHGTINLNLDSELHVLNAGLNMIYQSLKEIKILLGPCTIQNKEDLPDNPPELKVAALHFLNNEFEPLDEMLMLNDPSPLEVVQLAMFANEFNSSQTAHPGSVSKAKQKPEKKPSAASVSQSVRPAKKCRNCPRTEERRGSFLACEKCQQQKYPDVNFFCSKSCKYAWWKAEHMAEHLEFELGIADFSHLNLHQGHKTGGKKGGKEGPSQ